MRRLLAAAVLSLAALLAAPGARAYTIDTGPDANSPYSAFGSHGTGTFGETFVVPGPETLLTSFTLYLNGSDTSTAFLDLRGYVGVWDGTKVTSILYTSATQTVNITANQILTFNPDISLTAGGTYVAFLSISELPLQADGLIMDMPLGSNTGGFAGDLVFIDSGTNFSALTSGPWACGGDCGVGPALFQATLVGAVPEPASLALLGAGLAGLGVIRRRRL